MQLTIGWDVFLNDKTRSRILALSLFQWKSMRKSPYNSLVCSYLLLKRKAFSMSFWMDSGNNLRKIKFTNLLSCKDEKARRQHLESATDNNRLSMKVKRKLNWYEICVWVARTFERFWGWKIHCIQLQQL